MEEKAVIQIGEYAKDFTLQDQHGKDFVLSSAKGMRVLLSFHPLAWTPVCARQMQTLESHRDVFDRLKTIPLGLSVDSVPCKNAWAKSLNIQHTKLLADFWPHGEVASQLGLFRQQDGISERANVILDEEGKAVFVKVYPMNDLPPIDEIIAFCEKSLS